MSTHDDDKRQGTGQRAKDRPAPTDKAERLEAERPREQEEGLAPARRGGDAAPSDRPENHPPHPEDVNEIGEA